MTIEEIKSVSIVQFLESQGYHHVYILKENYWYLSPFRTEASPSFNVSPKKNLWNDFGAGEGGNLINLVQKMNPSWNNHEVLTYLEQKIKEHHLQYSEDYEAQRKEDERKEAWKQDQAAQREKAKEANTIIERIVGLSHPYLREYILQRRIDYDIAKEYCKEVHYRIYDKSYYAIAFENIEGGMEARNKYSKRSIGKKSISIIRPNNEPHKECCICEGKHGREVQVDDIKVEPVRNEQGEIQKDEKGNAKFRMTAVINGESISHEITQKQYDKFMAIDDYHRMKLFSHIFKEVDMKTIPGEGKNIGAQIGGALLAGLAVMSELGRDRPAPAVFVEHHHDHAHGPHVYFKVSVDSPQDLASRAFDAGLNAGEHGVGLGHGR